MLLDIILGIVGAVIGGFLFQTFGMSGVTGGNLLSVLVAVVGAIVVLVVYQPYLVSSIPSSVRGASMSLMSFVAEAGEKLLTAGSPSAATTQSQGQTPNLAELNATAGAAIAKYVASQNLTAQDLNITYDGASKTVTVKGVAPDQATKEKPSVAALARGLGVTNSPWPWVGRFWRCWRLTQVSTGVLKRTPALPLSTSR